jgi:PKD repeat protein
VLTSGQHLLKFEFTETGTNMNYFTTTYEGVVAPKADFSASTITSCTGSQVLFTNQSSQTLGTETYLWNFGAGANPATANTAGPHTVVYSSVGQKSISLQVTNANGTDTETKINYVSIAPLPTSCLWSDDFDNHTVNWIAPVPGAFTHEETGTTWSIANNGYGEWQNFTYTLNDGSVGTPINFQCTANKPILKIRAKASANCLLRASLMDVNGRVVDNINAIDLELTPAYQTFTINFAGRFRNYNSGNPGILDSSNITRVQFYINPGYFSYPITGANANYNSAFNGIVDIDWIGIGDNCSPPLITDIVSYESRGYSVMPNPFVDETIVNLDAFNGEKATIKVMDSQGRIVYTREDQSTTAPFKWGKEFPVGLYVMTAVNDQKAITFRVIKAK